jgi:hypothetical protein
LRDEGVRLEDQIEDKKWLWVFILGELLVELSPHLLDCGHHTLWDVIFFLFLFNISSILFGYLFFLKHIHDDRSGLNVRFLGDKLQYEINKMLD